MLKNHWLCPGAAIALVAVSTLCGFSLPSPEAARLLLLGVGLLIAGDLLL